MFLVGRFGTEMGAIAYGPHLCVSLGLFQIRFGAVWRSFGVVLKSSVISGFVFGCGGANFRVFRCLLQTTLAPRWGPLLMVPIFVFLSRLLHGKTIGTISLQI